jgi:ankyrin repeat protein
VQAGASATERKPDGTSTLQTAVAINNEEMVTALFFFNADPSVDDGDSQLPIFVAIDQGRLNLVKLLIDSGADIKTLGILTSVVKARGMNWYRKLQC